MNSKQAMRKPRFGRNPFELQKPLLLLFPKFRDGIAERRIGELGGDVAGEDAVNDFWRETGHAESPRDRAGGDFQRGGDILGTGKITIRQPLLPADGTGEAQGQRRFFRFRIVTSCSHGSPRSAGTERDGNVNMQVSVFKIVNSGHLPPSPL